MIRSLVLLALATALAGCATETRVIHDNSPNAKFAALFGSGTTATSDGNSGGWTVTSHAKNNQPTGPVSDQARRIAELLRNQANAPRPVLQDRNPGSWKVTTSFPTDGQPAEQSPQTTVPLNPTPDPWGASPVTPALPGSVLPTVPTATPSR